MFRRLQQENKKQVNSERPPAPRYRPFRMLFRIPAVERKKRQRVILTPKARQLRQYLELADGGSGEVNVIDHSWCRGAHLEPILSVVYVHES